MFDDRKKIFAVLGPFPAWLVGIAFLAAVEYPKPVFEDGRYWIPSVMVCYAFSFLPLLFTAWIDRRLADKWWRSIVCFAAGFGLAVALYYGITHEGGREETMRGFHQYWLYVGLVWGLPAAVCSWVVGKIGHDEAVRQAHR